MKNITFSADEKLIEAARARARAERSTLNVEFRRWLARYSRLDTESANAVAVIDALRSRVRSGGKKFTGDDMNER